MNIMTFLADKIHIFFIIFTFIIVLGWFYFLIKFQLINSEFDSYLKKYHHDVWLKVSPMSNFWSLNYYIFIKKIFSYFKFIFDQDYLHDSTIGLLKNKLKYYFKISIVYLLTVIVSFFILFFAIWIFDRVSV